MKKIRTIVAISSIVFTLASFLTSAQTNKLGLKYNAEGSKTQLSVEESPLEKDETVYISLNYDGSKEASNIVNYIKTPKDGVYIDYGNYTHIKSLTNAYEPKLEGDKIIWELPLSDSGFYYQGTLKNSEPPYEFGISYTLNGKEIKGEDLIGKSGKVGIKIKVDSNPNTYPYYKDYFMCQLQIPMMLDRATNILAEGSQSVTVGKTKTLAFMVLPGQSKEFTIGFDGINFEMDSMTATVVPFDSKDFISIDTEEIKTGIVDMVDGTEELINGTKQLKNGMSQFAGGIGETAEGAKKLTSGSAQLKEGIKNYTAGVTEINSNMSQLSGGLNQLAENGNQISLGYDQLSQGVSGLLDSFTPILETLPDEQKGEYQKQIAYLELELSNYSEGLNNYTNGIAGISQGVTGLHTGLDRLDKGNLQLVEGAMGLNLGLTQFSKGVNDLHIGFSRFPSEMQKIIDGQIQLQEGIKDSTAMLDEFDFVNGDNNELPISFANNEKNISSVQFIMRTPELKKNVEIINPKIEDTKTGFWERVKLLFK